MVQSDYKFFALPEEILKLLMFDPIQFPVRHEKSQSVFTAKSVNLDMLLEELDQFVKEYPDHREELQGNGAKLAMLCATSNVAAGDFPAALANLHCGLRVYPGHTGLKVHQALALQVSGYTEVAAMEYELLLQNAPQAYDPVLRALAARAFAAIDRQDKALEIINFLPEAAFLDPSLFRLRQWLLDSPHEPKQCCPACGETMAVDCKICPFCTVSISGEQMRSSRSDRRDGMVSFSTGKKFCTSCGCKLGVGGKFCTGCGTEV